MDHHTPIDGNPPLPPPGDSLPRRIIAFPLTLLVIGFVMVMLTVIAIGRGARAIVPHPPAPLLLGLTIVVVVAVIAVYKAFKRWVERAPDTELPLAGAGRELSAGLGLGLSIFTSIVAVVWALGGISFHGAEWPGDLVTMLSLSLFSGVVEEMVFRGIFLRLLERMIGTWGALAITSAFFGVAHLANPHATVFAAFAIAMEAGILLGAAYLYTRRLWLAIGIHAAWNFTQGWIFGIPVSGSAPPAGLLLTERTGSDWLTGGAFGLEASAVALVVATAAGVAMLLPVARRGGIVPPMWLRGQTKL